MIRLEDTIGAATSSTQATRPDISSAQIDEQSGSTHNGLRRLRRTLHGEQYQRTTEHQQGKGCHAEPRQGRRRDATGGGIVERLTGFREKRSAAGGAQPKGNDDRIASRLAELRYQSDFELV